jgi:hypothetical protein
MEPMVLHGTAVSSFGTIFAATSGTGRKRINIRWMAEIPGSRETHTTTLQSFFHDTTYKQL